MILKRRFFSAGLMHIILIVVSAFAIYPVFMMVAGSFKSPSELLTNVAGLPAAPTWTNYMRLLNYNSGLIVRTYLNSIFISSAYTMLAIFLSSMAGFAFAKYKFKGRELIFLLLLITMMVPPELNLPPQYLMFSRIGWLHTYQVQIIPGVANVFALFMMRQYMQSIPDSLLEAARIDGAGHFTIYRRIVMPTASPEIGRAHV